jgi:hypothetical protein
MEYCQGRAVGGGNGLLCGDEEERFRSAFGMTGLLFLVLKVGSRRTEEKSAGLQTRHCPRNDKFALGSTQDRSRDAWMSSQPRKAAPATNERLRDRGGGYSADDTEFDEDICGRGASVARRVARHSYRDVWLGGTEWGREIDIDEDTGDAAGARYGDGATRCIEPGGAERRDAEDSGIPAAGVWGVSKDAGDRSVGAPGGDEGDYERKRTKGNCRRVTAPDELVG